MVAINIEGVITIFANKFESILLCVCVRII